MKESRTLNITAEQWLAELGKLGQQTTKDDDGFRSAREIVKATGIPLDRLRVLLQQAKDVGRLEVKQILRPAIDDRMRVVSAYRIRPAK